MAPTLYKVHKGIFSTQAFLPLSSTPRAVTINRGRQGYTLTCLPTLNSSASADDSWWPEIRDFLQDILSR